VAQASSPRPCRPAGSATLPELAVEDTYATIFSRTQLDRYG